MALATESFRVVANNQLQLNRRRRNAVVSPIFQCPDEILVLIFESLIASSTAPYQIEGLRIVCRRWYQVIESTPAVWSYIYIDNESKPQKVRAQLTKSQATPLVIEMENFTSNGNKMLNILFDHIPRWQSVTLDLTQRPEFVAMSYAGWDSHLSLSDLRRMAETPAPFLRTFDMEIDGRFPMPSLPMNLFGGYAPLLRHLRIPHLSISWDNPILSGLTSLSIYAWDGSNCPSAEQYTRLFVSCPGLEDLRIQGNELELANPIQFQLDLNLPRLTRLHLVTVDQVTMRSIISSINGPLEYVGLEICSLPSEESLDVMQSTFLDFDRSSIFIPPSTIHTLSITSMSGYMLKIEVISEKGDGHTSKRMFASDEDAEALLFAASHILAHPTTHLYQVPAGGTIADCSATYLQRLLEELTELKELRLDSWEAYYHILPLLGQPVDVPASESKIPRWLCPNLRKFYVEVGDADIEILYNFAKSRYCHPSGFHPGKLEQLELSISNCFRNYRGEQEKIEQFISDIRDVIGGDVVTVTGTLPPLQSPPGSPPPFEM
ncbi:hypothetical protein FRC03_001842 [Tulasnella sp. 419]|nr:hypothetical protein FRC03_001842 [Tulasnella sp. 419]